MTWVPGTKLIISNTNEKNNMYIFFFNWRKHIIQLEIKFAIYLPNKKKKKRY